jgi:hypothetical protein
MSRIKKSLLVGLGVASLVLVGTAAHAVITGVSGTISDQQRYVNETTAWSTGAPAFVDVPGAVTTITVPSGTRRMIDARFTAESLCTGSSGTWCSVRIVVVRPSGVLLELNPRSGTDFAFDSAGPDNWESHAIERTSPYLGAGTYRVKVQAGVVSASSLRLDDWTFAVERVRP